MKHYTIMLSRPESNLRSRFPAARVKQAPGLRQFVAWDGPARLKDVQRLYQAIAPYCGWIGLFCGRDSGKLIVQQGKI